MWLALFSNYSLSYYIYPNQILETIDSNSQVLEVIGLSGSKDFSYRNPF
jgi:hypothetical protein